MAEKKENPPVDPRAIGTQSDVEKQGFTGAKIQSEQQASPGAQGSEVPDHFPLPADTDPSPKNASRKNASRFTVTEDRFHFNGQEFKKDEAIYLTEEEAQRARSHVKK